MNRRELLARLDHGFEGLTLPGLRLYVDDSEPVTCARCDATLCGAPGSPFWWCPRCRSVHGGEPARFLGRLPERWSAESFFEFWSRAVDRRVAEPGEQAFGRFVLAEHGIGFEEAGSDVEPEPVAILLGELAAQHRLMSRAEVEWIAQLQRITPARRRRHFGEIAVRLGLLGPEVLAPLLAAQAERARGLAGALAKRHGISQREIVAAERKFFGLFAMRAADRDWPIDRLLSAGWSSESSANPG